MAPMAELGTDFATSPNAAGELDLGPNLSIVNGRRGLAEAIARRLETPNGQNLSDRNYGTDMRLNLSSAARPALIARQAENECLKDERVEDASVTATFPEGSEEFLLEVTLTDADGPFDFTLNVSDVTVELLATQGF